MPAKILLVDDDAGVIRLLKRYLVDRGFAVIHADNGSEALLLVRESQPDLILVDARMPGLDGLSVCRVLKKEADCRHIPIVIMSGTLVEEQDVLAGFAGGADDYVAKPFSLPVLLARLQALLRTEREAEASAGLRRAGLELDAAARSVTVAGKPVALTRKEFDLLAVLLSRSGRVLSVPYLLETVWGYDPADYNDPGTVEVHVSHLRKKLGPKLGRKLVNVQGHGYKFEPGN